jgi:hypothetical protein
VSKADKTDLTPTPENPPVRVNSEAPLPPWNLAFPPPKFKLGDRVKIRLSSLRGRIVELRGPLGPHGAQIYRVRFRRKPSPAYIEVREDQLALIPAKT